MIITSNDLSPIVEGVENTHTHTHTHTHTQSNETKYLRRFLTNLDLVNDTALNIPPHCLNVSQLLVVCVRRQKYGPIKRSQQQLLGFLGGENRNPLPSFFLFVFFFFFYCWNIRKKFIINSMPSLKTRARRCRQHNSSTAGDSQRMRG